MSTHRRYFGRFKPDLTPALFHCMCATRHGYPLLDEAGRSMFQETMRAYEIFCGMNVLTYAILNNRFHMLVRVDRIGRLSDKALVERLRVIDGDERAEWLAEQLAESSDGTPVRERLLKRMGDISIFQKEMKHRFSNWYNQERRWFGTIWESRFRSVFVQPKPEVVATVAAFIDLLPARENEDPKNYPFCGYGEAVAGGERARQGLASITGAGDWPTALAAYRKILAGEDYRLADIRLTCRVRHYTRDVAAGHPSFVRRIFDTTQPH